MRVRSPFNNKVWSLAQFDQLPTTLHKLTLLARRPRASPFSFHLPLHLAYSVAPDSTLTTTHTLSLARYAAQARS